MDYWRKEINMGWYTASDAIRASGLKLRETISPTSAIIGLVVVGFILNAIWSMVS